jgi:hypothetical protein
VTVRLFFFLRGAKCVEFIVFNDGNRIKKTDLYKEATDKSDVEKKKEKHCRL